MKVKGMIAGGLAGLVVWAAGADVAAAQAEARRTFERLHEPVLDESRDRPIQRACVRRKRSTRSILDALHQSDPVCGLLGEQEQDHLVQRFERRLRIMHIA